MAIGGAGRDNRPGRDLGARRAGEPRRSVSAGRSGAGRPDARPPARTGVPRRTVAQPRPSATVRPAAPYGSAAAGAGSGRRPAYRPASDSLAYARSSTRYAAGRGRGGASRVVLVVALAVLVVSLGALAFIGFTYWNGQKAYEDLEDLAFAPPAAPAGATLADFSVDWDALRAVNSDVVGWVYVPDTELSYPVVQRAYDESYYLSHNFNEDSTGVFGAEYGCIMLSAQNRADFSDQLNILFGHNMANGAMFSLFADFADGTVFNEHREVYVLSPKGSFRLRTFAIDYIDEMDTTIIRPHFSSNAELAEYVQKRLDDSLVTADPPDLDVAAVNKVFAFSTCDNSNDAYRYIVFASVEEYLPAGAEATPGSGAVDPADVASVDDAATARAVE